MLEKSHKKNANVANAIENSWFQILLIVIGFLLGSFGTYFWQWKEINTKKHTIANVLSVTIRREIKTSRLLIELLKKEKTEPGQLAPHGFKFLHEPVYFSKTEDIGILEEEIIIAMDTYFRSLKACQAMRDFLYEGLELLNEDVVLAKDYIAAYIHQLENFVEIGDAVLEAINDKYPQKQPQTVRKEFLPKVEVFDMEPKK
jgi:hypothetical protein